MKNPFAALFQTKSAITSGQNFSLNNFAYSLDSLEAYAREGYGVNPTVYSCVSKIATNAANVKPSVKVNGEKVDDHPLLDLLAQPNIDQGGVEFRTAAISWYVLMGNSFIEKQQISSDKIELWNWKPFNMSIAASLKNPRMAAKYVDGKNTANPTVWDVDPITGASDLLHWRTFNPDPEAKFFGQATTKAAASSADQMNAADKWRYNTFKNDCSPSGILSTEQDINTKQRQELSKDLNDKSGSKSAKKFLLLGGGLKWQQLAQTAKDVDWLLGTKLTKQEVAEVFGVPTQLLGIEGSQTYANYEEARMAFYVETVLPILNLFASELTRWLAPIYGDDVEICYDENDIQALAPMKNEKDTMLLNSQVLTINEKRAVLGYEASVEPDADQIFIDSSKIPLGMDLFTDEEKDIEAVAKSFIKVGFKREEAMQKAFDLIEERKAL